MEFDEGAGPIPPEYHRLFGSKTGIVTGLTITPPGRGEPQAYVSAADAPDLGVLREGLSGEVELRTGGKAMAPDDVLARGIGETCERYGQWLPDPSRIRIGTYETVAGEGRTVPFEYLTVHRRGADDATDQDRTGEDSSAEEEATDEPSAGATDDPPAAAADGPSLPPLTRETTIAWTEGTDLLTGDSVSIPAELIWNGVGQFVDVPSRFAGTTNGCAAGERLVDALLGGLLEVIERDGVMRTWLTGRTPPALDPAEHGLDGVVREFLPDRHLSVHLFEFDSLPRVPTVGAAIVDERERRPKFAVGGAAGLDVEAAALDALAEIGQSWRYVKNLLAFDDPDPVELDDPVTNFEDNVLLYARPEHFDQVSFLLEGETRPAGVERSIPAGDQSSETRLDAVLAALHDADCTPIAVDVTPPDVDEVGIHVVRVYVPELLPLSLPSLPPTEHPSLAGEDCTSLPHPYP